VRVSFLEAAKPESAKQPQGVRVPSAAIVERGGQDVAFALDDEGSHVEQRTLKTGMAMGDDRQVLSGLVAGDAVVLDPSDEMKDGAKVRMAKETE
jgi:multidrug efflux pump subunit AcrA (membrane-fusion protein)